jgi:GNAT superfamily N-acetyltransferase
MPKTSPCSAHPPSLTLDAFLAAERPDLADLYRLGQADSYRRHPGSAAALRHARLDDAVVVLVRAGQRPVGGMRAHLRCPGAPLPVEAALGHLCDISRAIARAPDPLVELCGTWVDVAYRGTDLAAALTGAALAVTRSLGAARIVGCAHQHVLGLYRRFGAVVDPTLGVHPYPDERYQTCVFWADPFTCPEEQAVTAWADALAASVQVTFSFAPAAAA